MGEKVKVLQVLHGGAGFGGVESFITERYRLMDYENIRFDFAFAVCNDMEIISEDKMFYDTSFFSLNATYPGTERIQYYKFYKRLRSVCRDRKYDIIHVHSGSLLMQFFSFMAIKESRPKAWFAHAHHANPIVKGRQKSMDSIVVKYLKFILYPFFRKIVCGSATRLFACSVEAGKQAFGKEIETNKFEVLKNGIELQKFTYNPRIREELRRETATTDKTVFGLVGRVTYQKNPYFAIEVFNNIHKSNQNTVLWIVGNGDMQNSVYEKIKSLSLQDDVVLWGERNDVEKLMQGMDAILFPSIYEGLGIVAIEAQSTGLPVFASNCIPQDAGITDLMSFWPLSDGVEKWANNICKVLSNQIPRRNHEIELRNEGYDLRNCAARLEKIYREYVI